MKGIIDRFESNKVVVEIEGVTKDFPKNIFSQEVQVGDVVLIDGDTVKVLKDETEKLRLEIEELMDELFE